MNPVSFSATIHVSDVFEYRRAVEDARRKGVLLGTNQYQQTITTRDGLPGKAYKDRLDRQEIRYKEQQGY